MKTANLLMRYLRFVTFTSAMGNAYYLLASFGLAMRGEDYIMKLPSCSKGAFFGASEGGGSLILLVNVWVSCFVLKNRVKKKQFLKSRLNLNTSNLGGLSTLKSDKSDGKSSGKSKDSMESGEDEDPDVAYYSSSARLRSSMSSSVMSSSVAVSEISEVELQGV